jgi:protein ImuA
MGFLLDLRIPSAVSASFPESPKNIVIEGLRSRILSLERHAPRRGASALPEVSPSPSQRRRVRWELGCPECDALLPRGLESNSLHEIKGEPSAVDGASAADWMAGMGFAARLAVRRVDALTAAGGASPSSRPWVLWCWPRPLAGEFGSPSGAGFARLGLDPSRLIVVETARAGEALNAIEESLKAQSLAVVIGVIGEAELTPARRLSLAAGETATPCLLVTHPVSEPAGATATRWRVKRDRSAPHPFDSRAPGAAHFSIALERCKARPESAAQPPMLLEWSDETRRFDLAPVVADLPAQTRGADGRAFPGAVRAY